jgi:hypothetical protein
MNPKKLPPGFGGVVALETEMEAAADYDIEKENILSTVAYLKNLFLPIIYSSVKIYNSSKEKSKIIVSGGEAIKTLFPSSKELETYDVDLKLVVPRSYVWDENTKKALVKIAANFTRSLAEEMEEYINGMPQIYDSFYEKYGTSISSVESDKSGTSLFVCGLYVNDVYFSLVDVFVSTPDEVKHYKTFIEDPILAKGSHPYYIPTFEYQGIQFAALGYVLWDTQQMIEKNTQKKERYVEKYKAMIQALNSGKGLSCQAMGNFVKKCYHDLNMQECVIDDQKVAIEGIVEYGVRTGYIPKEYEELFTKEFSKRFICSYLKELNAYGF